MKIQLWFNEDMNYWRWTLTTDEIPRRQESGQRRDIDSAMGDISKAVKWLSVKTSN